MVRNRALGPLVEVEILNPLVGKDRSEDKVVVLDVLARDSSGRLFNIEMQELLGNVVTTDDELLSRRRDTLTTQLAELQQRLRARQAQSNVDV